MVPPSPTKNYDESNHFTKIQFFTSPNFYLGLFSDSRTVNCDLELSRF